MTEPRWWHPARHAARRPRLIRRGRMIDAVRRVFRARDFVEVETPALQVSPGLEVHLRSFATTLEEPGRPPQPRHLHTSPEFAMKKLLVAGETRIFQLARVFRNAERAATHHPEFTMLEWYRAGAGPEALMQDCVDLARAVLKASGRSVLRWQGGRCDPWGDWELLSVAGAFARYAGIDLMGTMPDPHAPDLDRLARAAAPLGIAPHDGDRWEDLFFRIFLERIEPHLGQGTPTFLEDYPISMAALARPKPDDPRVAERFELYLCGLEIANGFGELTDPVEQRRRFLADLALREQLYGTRVPIDEDFLDALGHGMPAAAGIALGFDRLAMLALGADHIEDVLWAPVEGAPDGEQR